MVIREWMDRWENGRASVYVCVVYVRVRVWLMIGWGLNGWHAEWIAWLPSMMVVLGMPVISMMTASLPPLVIPAVPIDTVVELAWPMAT